MKVKVKGISDVKSEPLYIVCDPNVHGTNVHGTSVFETVNSIRCDCGHVYPAQKYKDGIIAVVDTAKGVEREYTLSDEKIADGVDIKVSESESRADFYIGGKLFTSFNYSTDYAKPFIGHIPTSFGEAFTRLDFTAKEHPHHRSVFAGIGEVNGVDFWNEPQNMGYQRVTPHQGAATLENGAAFGSYAVKIVWSDSAGKPLLDEIRTITVYNQSVDCRYLDIGMNFTASYEDIEFGATKEAGPLGVRMNDKLRADTGTGHIVNSYGAENESACWGKAADWCDYSGELGGVKVGIAIFDNPQNERFPTTWHCRDYGLFAPNNFYFKGGYSLKKGESVDYKYRLCFHENNFNPADRYAYYNL
jgi:hypothetical protein